MSESTSKLNILIEGNAEGASKAFSEISKAASGLSETMAKIGTEFGRIGETVSKSVQDMLKSVSRLSDIGKDFSGVTKGTADVSKAISGVSKAVTDQTKAMRSDFESLNKTTQDSAIGIVSEIDKIDRSIKEMGNVLSHTSSEMNKNLAGMRSQFTHFTTQFDETAKKSEESGKKVSKAVDFAAMQITGQQLMGWGEKIVGFFTQSVKAAAEFSQTMANTRAALDSQPGSIRASNKEMQTMQQLALKLGSTGFYSA